MSTRSTIGIQNEDGTVTWIYCHNDGYPEHQYEILKKYYNSEEKARAILALGNLSFLDKSLEKPEGHSFETPVRGYTISYMRDRDPKGRMIFGTRRLADDNAKTTMPEDVLTEQYNYIWKEGQWQMWR